MPKLDELPADVRVAFFGKWEGAARHSLEDQDEPVKVESPDPEELCYRCFFAIGSRTTGASVRADDDSWVHYHRDCYWEAVQEAQTRDMLTEELDADDVDPW